MTPVEYQWWSRTGWAKWPGRLGCRRSPASRIERGQSSSRSPWTWRAKQWSNFSQAPKTNSWLALDSPGDLFNFCSRKAPDSPGELAKEADHDDGDHDSPVFCICIKKKVWRWSLKWKYNNIIWTFEHLPQTVFSFLEDDRYPVKETFQGENVPGPNFSALFLLQWVLIETYCWRW